MFPNSLNKRFVVQSHKSNGLYLRIRRGQLALRFSTNNKIHNLLRLWIYMVEANRGCAKQQFALRNVENVRGGYLYFLIFKKYLNPALLGENRRRHFFPCQLISTCDIYLFIEDDVIQTGVLFDHAFLH